MELYDVNRINKPSSNNKKKYGLVPLTKWCWLLNVTIDVNEQKYRLNVNLFICLLVNPFTKCHQNGRYWLLFLIFSKFK
jgi:hypothetical protein